MKVQIQSVHFDADKKLIQFIEQKVSKLKNYFDGVIGGEVTLRIDKSSTLENKVAEIKISLPGNNLFAKKQCQTFEEACDLAVDALVKQVKKRKDKLRNK